MGRIIGDRLCLYIGWQSDGVVLATNAEMYALNKSGGDVRGALN